MDYTAHNVKVFKIGIKEHTERVIKPKLETLLRGVAQRMVDLMNGYFKKGDKDFPIWTGNLRDATGLGVYVDGRLSAYMPMPIATKPQSYGNEKDIIGTERLAQAIKMASTTFGKGIWLVLFSAVPYAYDVNAHGSPKERGFRFFELLTHDVDTLVEEILSNLKPIAV